MKKFGLTGNQLKLLALITMTADHVGLELLPGVALLRIVGRLAFPIYGWMIAEGCRHTHSPRRYLLRLGGLAMLCQVVYFVAMGSLYQSVMVTFTLSAGLIFACDRFRRTKSVPAGLAFLGLLAGAAFLSVILPELLSWGDFAIDYGLWGILLPLLVYLGRDNREKLALLTLALVALGLEYGGVQWWGLMSVPILALYNGQRGRKSLGRFFYWYYPAHLVAIYAIHLALLAL